VQADNENPCKKRVLALLASKNFYSADFEKKWRERISILAQLVHPFIPQATFKHKIKE
jgi:hypothetical protein